MWAELRHPNILTFHGFCLDIENFEVADIITPWQWNGHLGHYIETNMPNQDGRLKLVGPQRLLRTIENLTLMKALDTARGLQYLHSLRPHPVCHGDLKLASKMLMIIFLFLTPYQENTVVDKEGNAMLCDFGLARIDEEGPSGLTTSDSTKYTPRYASPELLMVTMARHTLKSDIWAWGCLLLGGSLHFPETNFRVLMMIYSNRL